MMKRYLIFSNEETHERATYEIKDADEVFDEDTFNLEHFQTQFPVLVKFNNVVATLERIETDEEN